MERYELESSIEASVKMIREKAGADGKVITLVSGGVDGMVTAALLLKALPPENVYAIHVDHGFMRKNESRAVGEMLKKFGFKNLETVNAQEEFLNGRIEINGELAPPLREVADPELKRQIIGSMFIETVKKAADKFGLDYDKTFIAQGTLRPDLIESGNPEAGSAGKRVKTHHNDVDIVRRARERGMIIETNRDWYKEDARQVARMLGIDEETASRQPFPGPGLAVRLICSDGCAPVKTESFQPLLNEFLSARKVSGIIAPILSVGVKGGSRSYKNLAVLYGGADFKELERTVAEIPENLDFINRCAYVLNKKSIDNLTCNKLSLSAESAELVRGIDHIVTGEINKYLKESGKKITQYFGILIPVSSSGAKKYSAVIRAFITVDFMTGYAALPGRDIPLELLRGISDRIVAEYSEIDLVLYDMTGKPPATMEWE